MSTAATSETAEPVFATPDSINELVDTLPRSTSTPDEVSALLDVARDLLTTSVIHYEFAAVAAEKSLQAVESAVRYRFDSSKAPYAKLIERLAATRELDDATIDIMTSGRELRNQFAHPRTTAAFPLTMAVDVIATTHYIIAMLYPDTSDADP